MQFSYPKYLDAKRTVDERARHPGVWSAFIDRLEAAVDPTHPDNPVRILEIGGGVGDLAIKTITALPDTRVEYTLIDIEPDNLKSARSRLRAALPGAKITEAGNSDSPRREALSLAGEEGAGEQATVHLVHDDITDIVRAEPDCTRSDRHNKRFDAICGQAIMDIIPAGVILRRLSHLLRDAGVAYLPIHFDGRTDFEPLYDASVDRQVSEIYHRSMTRTWTDATGTVHSYDGARSGRDLISHAAAAGLSVAAAGASDWMVMPSAWREGRTVDSPDTVTSRTGETAYPAREAYFLECMLHFIEGELTASDQIATADAKAWLKTRRDQLDRGELALFVHNLDVLLARET